MREPRTLRRELQQIAAGNRLTRLPKHAVLPRATSRRRFRRTTARRAGAGDFEHAARDERMRRLEAILLLAREPLSSRKLSQYANLADATEGRTLVRRLNQLYDEDGRAFRVEEVAGGFRLLTRPQFAPWLRRMEQVPRETRLSPPAMETLAVVAYRQPTTRAEIEAIRGVSCGEILRQLMERDLVRIGGRSDELGRPYLYETTRRFLQVFGLKNLNGLPRVEVFRNADHVSGSDRSATHSEQHLDRVREEDSQVAVKIAAAGVSTEHQYQDEREPEASAVPPCTNDLEDNDLEDEVFEEEDDELDDEEEFDDEEEDDFDDEDEDDVEDDLDEDDDDWEEVDDEDDEDEEDDDEEDDDDDDDWDDDDDSEWEDDDEEDADWD